MFRLVCLLIGYLCGCFQTAYIVGRFTRGIDIREHGSKSAGMTNTFRVMGRREGVIVFASDLLKALLAAFIGAKLYGGDMFTGPYALPGLYAGLGAVLGHNFPFFLKFRGGKGVASALGTLLAIDWQAALVTYATGIITIFFSRYVSLASLLMTALAPALFALRGHGAETVAVSAGMGVMAWALHRGNIQRLLAGTESPFSLKKKQK